MRESGRIWDHPKGRKGSVIFGSGSSGLGWLRPVAPWDKLDGRDKEIWAERDRRLEAARECWKKARRKFLKSEFENGSMLVRGETEAGSAGEQLAEG